MVEKDNAVIKDLRRNQEILAMSNIEITNSNGINYLERLPKGFDVIFLDPPYQSDLLSKSLDIISKTDVLSNSGVVYIEYQTRPNLDGYDIIKESKAGNVGYMLITPIRK